jgi:hypothetical protein
MVVRNIPNIMINRAPVVTLSAATVAKRLGFERDEALSVGKTVTGLTVQAKGRGAICVVASRAATVYRFLDVAHPEVASFDQRLGVVAVAAAAGAVCSVKNKCRLRAFDNISAPS